MYVLVSCEVVRRSGGRHRTQACVLTSAGPGCRLGIAVTRVCHVLWPLERWKQNIPREITVTFCNPTRKHAGRRRVETGLTAVEVMGLEALQCQGQCSFGLPVTPTRACPACEVASLGRLQAR